MIEITTPSARTAQFRIEHRLLATGNVPHTRQLWERVRAKGLAEELPTSVRDAEAVLAELEPVTALDGLQAHAALVRWLQGSRWNLIQLAREEGATWAAIAQAVDLTADEVRDIYRTAIDG